MSIATVQIVRKIVLGVAILIGIGLFAVTGSSAPSGTFIHEMIEWTGMVAIVVCIFGRSWCTMYIGGRKVEQFVTEGPYSVTRNPLYLFSILGAAGIGAQTGSVVIAVICAVLAWVVFYLVTLQEEQLLTSRYPGEYPAYMAKVPRFVPNMQVWRDVPTLTVAPGNVFRTFWDAIIMLLAVPLAETIDILQDFGWRPVLFHLP